MSLRAFAKRALPWIALALAIASLGYSWNWALAKASERHRTHHAFVTGTSKYIFSLCPSTPLVDAMPPWATDMRGFCQAHQPSWGSAEHGAPGRDLDIETGSTWQAVQLVSKLVLEITPGKALSLLTLVVISLAGLVGPKRGWFDRPSLQSPPRITRGAALTLLSVVLLALSASLVLLDSQEAVTMCQMTGNTYANLLSIDARCSQQTMLLRDTQALLDQKKGELDARARELDDMKREIASLGAMRDALGTFKTELKSQSESTQQLIMAVTGATLDSITKAVDPLHKDVKGLDQSLKTDFKDDLRSQLRGDMKSLVQDELRAALQSEQFKDVIQREVREAVQEDVRAVVRGELRDSMKTLLAAGHAPAPVRAEPPPATPVQVKAVAPAKAAPPAPRKPTTQATQGKPSPTKATTPAQGKR
ncbi:hypothetical protein JRI60_19740 [Archangium violaceum]|uniref:hypothetical protein n=1 Tax=Archangium violaceum TaxID=83451 RepID=UPI00194EEE14|nr:hypothetical protein [Archangium violaceum]QRO01106.1 hypothetical protein JRI60_19740 [Archangium violaceum]